MTKDLITILVVAALSIALMFIVGCQSDAQIGSAVGALAGAGICQLAGAAIPNQR